MCVKPGQGYKAFRRDIVTPKPKYHLYLDKDLVFLINSEHDYHEFCIALEKSDCSILTKSCYLQVKSVYRFDKNYPIIKSDDMSERVLNALLKYLTDSSFKKSITKIQIKNAIKILTECIENRHNSYKMP